MLKQLGVPRHAMPKIQGVVCLQTLIAFPSKEEEPTDQRSLSLFFFFFSSPAAAIVLHTLYLFLCEKKGKKASP